MAEPLRLLFDASILGASSVMPRGRTGIFRATENIMAQCASDPDVSMRVWSGQYSYLTRCYLDRHHPAAARDYPVGHQGCTDRVFSILSRRHDLTEIRFRDSITDLVLKTGKLALLMAERQLCALDFRQLARECDIVLYPAYHFYPFAARAPRRVAAVHCIYDMTPVKFPEFFQLPDRLLFRHCLRRIRGDRDLIVVNSHSTKRDIGRYLEIDPSRVHVVPLAASDMFRPCTDPGQLAVVRSKYRIPAGQYFLGLATLEPRKNIDGLIRAFAAIADLPTNRAVNLVLVGTAGWKYSGIYDELHRHPQLAQRIVFAGFVPDQDLAPLYSGAAAFVYPSRYEGFGLPLLEAMQCGVPVISSDSSSLPEVVGSAGPLVAPDDTDGFAREMQAVLDNPAHRRRMAAAALERAKHFSWERTWDELKGVCRVAAERSRCEGGATAA